MKKIAIVSAYNNLVTLTMDFLDAFQHYWNPDYTHHMILVNGGCHIKIKHPFISQRIDLITNDGFCKVLNAGLKAVPEDSDYVFFVGNDSQPINDTWLPDLIGLQLRTDAWMVCPANDNPGMRIHWAQYTKEHPDHWEANFYPSIAWLMPYDRFKEVGLLDERFSGTGMFSDNDYCARILLQGGKIVVSKHILLTHLCGAEGKIIGTQPKDMDLGRAVFKEKWGYSV